MLFKNEIYNIDPKVFDLDVKYIYPGSLKHLNNLFDKPLHTRSMNFETLKKTLSNELYTNKEYKMGLIKYTGITRHIIPDEEEDDSHTLAFYSFMTEMTELGVDIYKATEKKKCVWNFEKMTIDKEETYRFYNKYRFSSSIEQLVLEEDMPKAAMEVEQIKNLIAYFIMRYSKITSNGRTFYVPPMEESIFNE